MEMQKEKQKNRKFKWGLGGREEYKREDREVQLTLKALRIQMETY